MSANQILADFCKSGTQHKYSRRFHSLSVEARRKAITDIQNGIAIDKAIKWARKGN